MTTALIRRREFITLLGGAAAAWPRAARTQPTGKVWRIAVVAGSMRPDALESSPQGGILQGMRELGYAEGKDFVESGDLREDSMNPIRISPPTLYG